jgi:hypothetical protein
MNGPQLGVHYNAPRLTDLSIDESFKACLVVSIKAHEADLVEDYIAISGLKILFLISLYGRTTPSF